jgi:Coenzyme PQQ synthesis protein D (PqqD)
MSADHPKLAANLSYTVIDGEAVVMNIDTGTYLGLNRVATRIVELLAAGRDTDHIVTALQTEYHVDEPTIRRDLERFISDATHRGILEISRVAR